MSFVSHAKPFHNFADVTDLFSWIECISDVLHSMIACSEIGITAKYCVVKELAVPTYAKISVVYQALNELSVHTAARVINNLFEFQFIF